ncbi:MAG: phage tail length tape measure family protein [Alphaproteobacteria bacterium]|nr:phage tail length tape measure family protein [Alphaproteobacteria bacterium]
MAERKVSVRLSVVDGGQFKAELADLGDSGNQALGAIGSGAANAGKAVHLNAQQLANLNYQISDIGVSLASGQNPFTVMLQQGSQIVQMFGPGTGILGALRAVGTGLITFLTNPLNLALLGFSAVTAAASYFFSAVAGPGEDANKTLEEQEDILGRIAGKYGEALPQVQRYADEIDRANRSAELADARVAAIDRAWREVMAGFDAAQGEIFDTYAILESIGAIDSVATLQHAVWDLQAALKTNTATAEEAQRIHDLLMTVFRDTGIPVTETLANRFAALGRAIAKANTEASAIGQEFSANVPAQGVLTSLQAELEALSKTEEQLRIEKELRKANVDAASEEGKAIAATVHQIFAESQARKEAASAEREGASARRAAAARATAEAERQHEAVADLIDSLRQEIEIGETQDPVQKELIRLRNQMAGATAEERGQIEELIRAKIALQSVETEDKGLFGASIDYLKDFVEKAGTAADLVKEAISGAFSSAADAVAEFVRTGKVNFASLITSMLADLARLAVQQAVLAPLAKLLGGLLGGVSGGGGGIGNILAGIFHEGGTVGGASASRSVPALAFAGASRLHGGGMIGLAPDEVPAILQRGERVLNRREARDYGSARSVTVNIATPDIENFRRARTQVAADIARAVSFGSRGL